MLALILKQSDIGNDATHKAHHYLEILRNEAQREINLLNDLLDLSRLQAGAEPRLATEVDLSLWVPHVAEAFEERMRAQQQTLQVYTPEAPLNVVMDASYLKRILTELLHNACKYTSAGETIALTLDMVGDRIQLRVSNSGIEIPVLEYARVFDKFYRIPNTDPWKHGGTGLGLALVKQIVEQLGGTIRVESGNNATCFTIQIPGLLPRE